MTSSARPRCGRRRGSPPWEARLRLRAAEELIETGRRAEGEAELAKALAFYRSVGATFYINRGEAAPRHGEPPDMAAQRRERKVVTVVFCDLVGFTSRAEQLDPEDVEALLGPYHERLRSELERHGGTVEKFIGDAVMALFGAPDRARGRSRARGPRVPRHPRLGDRGGTTSRYESPSRPAKRSIRLDARPEAGEGMASGDVVNTAARLQSAAPVNGILADETTYRATRQVVDYREAPAVEAKGKAEPIPVWEALAAHSRFGVDVAHEARTELVGRERELAVLRDTLDRARHERIPQLVTLVGVPGIGQEPARLRALPDRRRGPGAHHLAAGPLPRLRRRCHVLGARARSSRRRPASSSRDTEAEAAEKLQLTPSKMPSRTPSDARWVESHLRPLVGLRDRDRARGRPPRGGLRRVAALPRGARRAAAARARARGSALG